MTSADWIIFAACALVCAGLVCALLSDTRTPQARPETNTSGGRSSVASEPWGARGERAAAGQFTKPQTSPEAGFSPAGGSRAGRVERATDGGRRRGSYASATTNTHYS